MERPLVVEDDDLQIRRVTAKIMKQSWIADEGWPSTLATGQMATNSSHYKKLHRPSYVDRFFNPLTPNDPYRGRTAPLTSKRCILYIYSTNIGTEYFKHGI